ncbi:MAG: hypothetical protein IT305_14195 [Chloroflexi bacterium]|nr:hypothetical protein [Chloroflexota bacterium]
MTTASGERSPTVAVLRPPVLVVALPGVPTWPLEPFWRALGYSLQTVTAPKSPTDMVGAVAHSGRVSLYADPSSPPGDDALMDVLAAQGVKIVVVERDPRDAACQLASHTLASHTLASHTLASHTLASHTPANRAPGAPLRAAGRSATTENGAPFARDLSPALDALIHGQGHGQGQGHSDGLIAQLARFDTWRNHPHTLWAPFERVVGARLGGDDDTRLGTRLAIATAVGWRGSAFQLAHALSVSSGYDVRMGRWDEVRAWQRYLPMAVRASIERSLSEASLTYETRAREATVGAVPGVLAGLLAALTNEHANTLEAAEAQFIGIAAESEARLVSLGVLQQRLIEAEAKTRTIEARLVAAQEESEARRMSLQVLQERLAATQQESAARLTSLGILKRRLADAEAKAAARQAALRDLHRQLQGAGASHPTT